MKADLFLYEISLNYPFKNDAIFIKDFSLKFNDLKQCEILMLIEKNSFINELFLFSLLLQKKEKTFMAGQIFLKLLSNSFRQIYFLDNGLVLFSKGNITLCELNYDEMKVNF